MTKAFFTGAELLKELNLPNYRSDVISELTGRRDDPLPVINIGGSELFPVAALEAWAIREAERQRNAE